MDVKRIVGMVLVIGGAMFLVLMASVILYGELEPEASPYWWIGSNSSGMVTSVNPTRITIATEDAGAQSFRIDGLTRVVLQGSVRLTPGAFVRIKYKPLRDDNVARGIRVLVQANAVGEAPSQVSSPTGGKK